MTASTDLPSTPLRWINSATTRLPRSIADSDLSVVPARAKGVRRPATMATRRPEVPSEGMAGSYPGISLSGVPAPTTPPVVARRAALDALAREPFDVLVVGGGITGAGVARDAAMRGLRTALVEKDDFASGTSSRSSRLVHGGVRYLEHGDLRLVFEASHERRVLRRLAPHLVRPLAFTWPVYAGARIARWKLAAGLTLYDLLATFRNVARHERLSAARSEERRVGK